MKPSLLTQSLESLKIWLQEQGEKSFRAAEIHNWLFKKNAPTFEAMSSLSLALRAKLAEHFSLAALTLVRTQPSEDQQTTKYLWRLPDGALVESVHIEAPGRHTICVSSQIGCPARCSFCASGQKGFKRHLTKEEILAQVYLVDSALKAKGQELSHIVFMGMGEPLDNPDAVFGAIRDLTNPEKYNFSSRRVTVSTVGVIEGIERMIEEDLKINLVFSLHAPNQHIRKKIIPYARKYELADILKALHRYTAKTKRDTTYEYILIAGINDSVDNAQELAGLVRGKQITVNLIPYNPVPGVRLERPSHEAIVAFRNELDRLGIINTCRYTKGVDIAAACGQLALQEDDQKEDAV